MKKYQIVSRNADHKIHDVISTPITLKEAIDMLARWPHITQNRTSIGLSIWHNDIKLSK